MRVRRLVIKPNCRPERVDEPALSEQPLSDDRVEQFHSQRDVGGFDELVPAAGVAHVDAVRSFGRPEPGVWIGRGEVRYRAVEPGWRDAPTCVTASHTTVYHA